jgi:hypothetical protein
MLPLAAACLTACTNAKNTRQNWMKIDSEDLQQFIEAVEV